MSPYQWDGSTMVFSVNSQGCSLDESTIYTHGINRNKPLFIFLKKTMLLFFTSTCMTSCFLVTSSLLWIQGRWRAVSKPSVLQCCHHFALLWRSREEQRGGCHPPGRWESHGRLISFSNIPPVHLPMQATETRDAFQHMDSFVAACAGGRLCGPGRLRRRRPAANRKWRHLHAHFLQ